MKKLAFFLIFTLLIGTISGCGEQEKSADIAATTMPVYQFTTMLCKDTELTVTRLVTENISCLHDYSLNVSQVKAVEAAQLVVLSGAGLEEFMDNILVNKATVDASAGIALLESCHDHNHEDHDHDHQHDAHIWLSPANAMGMAQNICAGLKAQYPEHSAQFDSNLTALLQQLQAVLDYGTAQLSQLSCRELVTFHDGFAYLAAAFDLTILAAVEEESGSEASAQELIELIELVNSHGLPAIFTEQNGSTAAAATIASQTGATIYTLDMAMHDDWFTAMYHNIDTIREALG